MGKLFPDGFTRRSRREVSRLYDPPRGLRDHAGGRVVSAAHFADDRHCQSSATTCGERQRSTLEKLIANVAPCDAAALSNILIDEFASLGRVFSESRESLQRVIGPSHEVIELIASTHDAIEVGLRHDIQLIPIHATNQLLIDYLVMTMGYLSVEQLRILFLNRSNRLIQDEVLASGTLTTVMAYPRNIFRRAFDLSASRIVLVHNHPGGQAEPSRCDIEFTNKLKVLGQQMEIEVRDHIIISGRRWFSFLRGGIL